MNTIKELRALRPTARIIQVSGSPAVNPDRRQRKAKMMAMGIKSGKAFRRWRIALRRDYADKAEIQRNHDEYQAALRRLSD